MSNIPVLVITNSGAALEIKKAMAPHHSKYYSYTVGGYYPNSILTKSGGKVDSARYSDTDFDALKEQVRAEVSTEWDNFRSLYHHFVPGFQTEKELESRFEKNEARNLYLNQPLCLAVKTKDRTKPPFFPPSFVDDYLITRDEYIAKYVNRIPKCLAIVHDGQWYYSGYVRCFDMSADKLSAWALQCSTIFSTLSPNRWLTLVDCTLST